MLNTDSKQRMKVIGIFFLQSYKILTGNMLSLFIPQKCEGRMCSLKENYKNEDTYHIVVFYWNSVSVLLFLLSYIIELRREEWCVKYLDIDNNYPDNNLKKIIIKDKKLDKKMDKLNSNYWIILSLTTIIYMINILLSLKLLNDNYYNNSTISCFISFTLLVLMKLYNSGIVAYQSVKNDKMMSAYMSEFVSYNVLDDDYVKETYEGKKNNLLEDIDPEIIPIKVNKI